MRSINFKLLIVLCGLSILACSGAPEKPSIIMCQIDYPANQAICGPTSPSLGIYIIPTVTKIIPLSELDRATAFSPAEWQKLMNYKDQLEAWAQGHCK